MCVWNPGKIVTIETIPLKLPKKQWHTLDINPDHTYFSDEYSRHVLYITRIYFRYGDAEPELIGSYNVDLLLLFKLHALLIAQYYYCMIVTIIYEVV